MCSGVLVGFLEGTRPQIQHSEKRSELRVLITGVLNITN